MADYQTKDIGEFLEVNKPDSTTRSEEAEDEPISSTTANESPKEPSPLIEFGSSENLKEPLLEEPREETAGEDEKPATEESCSPKGSV